VARIKKRSGKGHGTGWLVRAGDFFPGQEGVLLLTCAHVVSATPNPRAIPPWEARVNFQVRGEILDVEDDVVWTSPPAKLDATLLALKGQPSAQPLCLHGRPAAMADPAPRMYIIGYPAGRDLELSLQDNHLLASSETLLHYRTPTEPGSSGSPVFEPEDWRVIALHHRGSTEMPRLDGREGTYQANEGIAILAIQKATAAS
jgi:V8-like Glu-specific endopeptidase